MSKQFKERKYVAKEDGLPMSSPPGNLSEFRAAYLDYIEGARDEPPCDGNLTEEELQIAKTFVESTEAAAGIDPYASRPSLEGLLAGIGRSADNKTKSGEYRVPPRPREGLTPAARWERIRAAVPLKDLRSKGWIPVTSDLEETEAAVCKLLEVADVEDPPSFAVAARRSNLQEQITPKQTAWLGYVRSVAKLQDVDSYDERALEELAGALPQLLLSGPSSLKCIPELFAKCGVRVVFAEGLSGGKLTGATTLLDDGNPVIGLTMSGDRYDSLIYTLLHECAHLTLGHLDQNSRTIIDHDPQGMMIDSVEPEEAAANDRASNWLFPGGFELDEELSQWIVAVAGRQTIWPTSRLYERRLRHWINTTAKKSVVHSSCVLGRVQYEIQNWDLLRAEIPTVKAELADAGLVS